MPRRSSSGLRWLRRTYRCDEWLGRGGKGDRGRGAEEAGEASGAEDVGKNCEEADDDTTDEEAKEQDCHSMRRRVGFSRRMTLCGPLCLLDEAHGFASFFAAEEFILFAFEPVIVDKEVFELLDEVFGEIIEFLHVGVHVVGLRDGDEPVVADALLAVDLFAADNTDKAGADETAGEGGLVHEKEDVDGIAVVGESAGEETEVVGEGHAGGENLLEREDLLVGVEAIFVAASLGSFNDDLKDAIFVDGL